ncbi:hypothetical protein BV25DRAFT_1821332 [Artomyces pyxidatus]|uniref:Uncharacterized protein n=1 Tax=Artomyces pyxidatus TaxID=48021 RepID=A0ACB8TA25_9AGAM|nr:hypothetical protein BV25DRAFT_1821332 [Artomyces pyxidatus]
MDKLTITIPAPTSTEDVFEDAPVVQDTGSSQGVTTARLPDRHLCIIAIVLQSVVYASVFSLLTVHHKPCRSLEYFLTIVFVPPLLWREILRLNMASAAVGTATLRGSNSVYFLGRPLRT